MKTGGIEQDNNVSIFCIRFCFANVGAIVVGLDPTFAFSPESGHWRLFEFVFIALAQQSVTALALIFVLARLGNIMASAPENPVPVLKFLRARETGKPRDPSDYAAFMDGAIPVLQPTGHAKRSALAA